MISFQERHRTLGMARAISLALCLTAFGLAEAPWKKPVESWSKNDANQILTRSPWARSVPTHDRLGPQRVVVRLEDALPIKQALGKMGLEPRTPHKTSYAVALVFRPTPGDGHLDWSKSQAFLKTSGRAVSSFSEMSTRTLADGTEMVIFLFPRTLEIGELRSFRLPFFTVHSRSIEFEVRANSLEIKQNFPLQDLFYFGKFEL